MGSCLLFVCFIAATAFVGANAGPAAPAGTKACPHLDKGDQEFYYGTFPEDFMWGFGTSSYQIEGAWNVSDKGESIWDRFAHTPGNIVDGSNGDVACDSYHKYPQDVEALKNIGANFYRFSISWPRIMPDGTTRGISQDGIDYYNRLIDALLAEGITPFVTLYHWELPQALQDIGGWPNQAVASHFGDFARVCFREFGNRVKHWITFNEPGVFCQLGHGYGSHAPGLKDPAELTYKCAHTVIMSHGYAYRIYDQEFRRAQGGVVGITRGFGYSAPMDFEDTSHCEASERSNMFGYGWFNYPLMYGRYPPIMREIIDAKSAAEGRNESRLPHFDEFWTQMINGTLDFHGLNHYTSYYVFPQVNDEANFDRDSDVERWTDPDWPVSAAPWLKVVPWGFRKTISYIHENFGAPVIYVTENGYADHDYESTNDTDRLNYYRLYINEMLKAIRLDGANVKGYAAWTLTDNFEWAAGYTERFGVHYIDWNDTNLTRIPKDSAYFLKQVFADNGFPEPKA